MALDNSNEHSFESTNWVWKKVILQGAPPPGMAARAKRALSKPLRARDPRKPLWVEVSYRGGPEAHWRVRARNRSWDVPGHLCLDDVLRMVNSVLPHGE